MTPRRPFDPTQLIRIADTFEGLLAAFADPPEMLAAADTNGEHDLRRVRFAPLWPPE